MKSKIQRPIAFIPITKIYNKYNRYDFSLLNIKFPKLYVEDVLEIKSLIFTSLKSVFNTTYSALVTQRKKKCVVLLCSTVSWHIDFGETSNCQLTNNCNPCLTSPSVLTTAIISNHLLSKSVFTTFLKIYLFKTQLWILYFRQLLSIPKWAANPY